MDVHRLPIIVITSVIVIDGRYQIRKHTNVNVIVHHYACCVSLLETQVH
jgi:hypothetical protein